MKPLNGIIDKDDYLFEFIQSGYYVQPVNDSSRMDKYAEAMDRIDRRMGGYKNMDNGIIEGPASVQEYIKKYYTGK